MEELFVARLRALQPDPAYMRLFNAIVQDVWREQHAEARRLTDETKRELAAVNRRIQTLENAYIYEKRIDKHTYEQQRDKLREESALLEIQLNETRLEELDLEALLAFAEHVLTDAARMWSEVSVEQRPRLQAVFFPQGLDFDGERFGTAVTCLAFKELAENSEAENDVASQSTPSWNQILQWLREMAELRESGVAAA
jgi:site-specific DNA recombinase